jgi:C1A family cysteine protease
MTAEVELWNGSDLDGTITRIKAALDSIHPVMLGSNVPPSFDSASAAGYVTYTNATEKSRGGHAYQIVGYLMNSTLTRLLPNAPLASGGGYLIAKNSWSVCFADAGYLYLPFDWVKAYGWSATVLQGLVQQ